MYEKENAGYLNLYPLPKTQSFSSKDLEKAEELYGETLLNSPILKTRSLLEIYERCNVAILEPNIYEEASKHEVWIEAMKEEIGMIEKNDTWKLVDKPKDRLHKALKQTPQAWYSKFDDHLIHCGFNRSENEATLYVKKAMMVANPGGAQMKLPMMVGNGGGAQMPNQ